MLAQNFNKHYKKIQYPCAIQPKLDGIRCIAVIKGGKAKLYTRNGNEITSMPHIVQELQHRFFNTVLDGELYNHNFKNNFEYIVSLVRQHEPAPNHTDIEYHVYDIVNKGDYSTRLSNLKNLIATNIYIKLVKTKIVHESEINQQFKNFRAEGYEGAMLRNLKGAYKHSRSFDLQKMKDFEEAEFKIIGMKQGTGKLHKHVGSFICRTEAGVEFNVKLATTEQRLKELFQDSTLWEAKMLTVRYNGLTGANNVPRFPIGIIIRDYE